MIIAATGHRPQKLGGFGDDVHDRLVLVARAYLHGKDVSEGISGMAIGWDAAWAVALLELGIPLIAAVPFLGQDSKWPLAARRRYAAILLRARDVVYVCDGGYAPWKMQRRNEWMVDRASRMAALWDGSEGGTANCIKYATAKGREIDNLWPLWSKVKPAP